MSLAKDTEFESRKKILEEIKQFNRAEQEELYRILRRCNEETSENRNGLFFDLMSLKQETVDKIREWITFCVKNRKNFETREKELSELMQGGFEA
jgi:hypothetical protein